MLAALCGGIGILKTNLCTPLMEGSGRGRHIQRKRSALVSPTGLEQLAVQNPVQKEGQELPRGAAPWDLQEVQFRTSSEVLLSLVVSSLVDISTCGFHHAMPFSGLNGVRCSSEGKQLD